jgi:hypothetical protein
LRTLGRRHDPGGQYSSSSCLRTRKGTRVIGTRCMTLTLVRTQIPSCRPYLVSPHSLAHTRSHPGGRAADTKDIVMSRRKSFVIPNIGWWQTINRASNSGSCLHICKNRALTKGRDQAAFPHASALADMQQLQVHPEKARICVRQLCRVCICKCA